MLLRHNENEKQADGDPIKTTRSRRDGGRVRGRGQTEAGTEHVVLRRSETHGPHGREVRKKLVTESVSVFPRSSNTADLAMHTMRLICGSEINIDESSSDGLFRTSDPTSTVARRATPVFA